MRPSRPERGMAVDLWRKGVPSIGETYGTRWTSNRSTGGLGTGVYAFVSEEAARQNVEARDDDTEVYRLLDACERPLRPRNRGATVALNRLSRNLDRAVRAAYRGETTKATLLGLPHIQRPRGWAGKPQPVVTDRGGTSLRGLAREVYVSTPELAAEFVDAEAFGVAMVEGAFEALAELKNASGRTAVQPINKALYPRYDGVVPTTEAGGADGQFGCVIFKERIDRCAGEGSNLAEFDTISASVLNRCFLS